MRVVCPDGPMSRQRKYVYQSRQITDSASLTVLRACGIERDESLIKISSKVSQSLLSASNRHNDLVSRIVSEQSGLRISASLVEILHRSSSVGRCGTGLSVRRSGILRVTLDQSVVLRRDWVQYGMSKLSHIARTFY